MIYGQHNKDILLRDFGIALNEGDECLFDDRCIWYKSGSEIAIYHYTSKACSKYTVVIIDDDTYIDVLVGGKIYCISWSDSDPRVYSIDWLGNKEFVMEWIYGDVVDASYAYGEVLLIPFRIDECDITDFRIGSTIYTTLPIRDDGNALYYWKDNHIYKLYLDETTEVVCKTPSVRYASIVQVYNSRIFILECDLGLISIDLDDSPSETYTYIAHRSDMYYSYDNSIVNYYEEISKDNKRTFSYDIIGKTHYEGAIIRLPDIKFGEMTMSRYSKTYADIDIMFN